MRAPLTVARPDYWSLVELSLHPILQCTCIIGRLDLHVHARELFVNGRGIKNDSKLC